MTGGLRLHAGLRGIGRAAEPKTGGSGASEDFGAGAEPWKAPKLNRVRPKKSFGFVED